MWARARPAWSWRRCQTRAPFPFTDTAFLCASAPRCSLKEASVHRASGCWSRRFRICTSACAPTMLWPTGRLPPDTTPRLHLPRNHRPCLNQDLAPRPRPMIRGTGPSGAAPQPDKACSGRPPAFEQAHAGTRGPRGRPPPLATPRYVDQDANCVCAGQVRCRCAVERARSSVRHLDPARDDQT